MNAIASVPSPPIPRITVKHPAMRLVFSGGTSLAKGYGLIQRFSEDIDFKVAMPTEGLNRSDFREYRERIVEAIRAGSEDLTE
jgi:predicted nucleotidyltransferase component of viral defense system